LDLVLCLQHDALQVRFRGPAGTSHRCKGLAVMTICADGGVYYTATKILSY
jgi:hypothetical protein